MYQGPIAQRSELPAHNRSVAGSNPAGPTIITGIMSLGTDLERLLSMLRRAGIAYEYDKSLLEWITIKGVRFTFSSVSGDLLEVHRTDS